MINSEDLVNIGKFQKTHALKGELNMITDIDSEYFEEGNPLIIDYDGIMVPYYVESIRTKGSSSYLVKLKGVDSEEEAGQFVNKGIYISKEDAKEWLEEYLQDVNNLLGYRIINDSNDSILGEITDIEDSTSNVLFIVKNEAGEELYLPASEDLIIEVDDDAREIRMIIPEGLLDINSKE